MRWRTLVLLALLATFSFGGTFTCRSNFDDEQHAGQRK